MPFNLFRKKKQPEQEAPAMPPQEEPKQEAPAPTPEQPAAPQEPTPEITAPSQEPTAETGSAQEPAPETTTSLQEQPQESATPAEQKPEAAEPPSKTYLKAMPLRELSDIEKVKQDVLNGNIIILRVTPLAGKSIEDVKSAVNELFQFAESIGGDIARLGEERVVICPKTVRIWREKKPAPVSSSEPLPTAA